MKEGVSSDRGCRPTGAADAPAWSDCGFLGEHESLEEVLASDAATLAELDITATELANTLGLLISAPEAISARRFRERFGEQFSLDPIGLERRGESAYAAVVERFGTLEFPRSHVALVAKRYVVKLTQYLGFQECPWGPRVGKLCGAASCDWQIRNTVRMARLAIPDRSRTLAELRELA